PALTAPSCAGRPHRHRHRLLRLSPHPSLAPFNPFTQLTPTHGRRPDRSRTILMEGPHPMTQPIQALNILGAQTPTNTSSAPAAETSPAGDDTVHQVVIVGSGPAGYTAAV